MIDLKIVLDAQGAWPDLVDAQQGVLERVGALPGGMASGKASVAVVIRLADGRLVFAETSLDLFLAAATALRARYGGNEPRGKDA